VLQIAKFEANRDAAEKRFGEVLGGYYSRLTKEQQEAIGDREQYVTGQIKVMLNPWMKFFLNYDPRPALERLKCPVLAINGSKDTQVVPEANLAAIANALQKGGNRDYTVRKLSGLNHLFQTAATGSPSEYGQIAETISPVALQLIYDWIAARVRVDAYHIYHG
jgi:fermentation-respiration switch protein FrsA (DUF1100 family)